MALSQAAWAPPGFNVNCVSVCSPPALVSCVRVLSGGAVSLHMLFVTSRSVSREVLQRGFPVISAACSLVADDRKDTARGQKRRQKRSALGPRGRRTQTPGPCLHPAATELSLLSVWEAVSRRSWWRRH